MHIFIKLIKTFPIESFFTSSIRVNPFSKYLRFHLVVVLLHARRANVMIIVCMQTNANLSQKDGQMWSDCSGMIVYYTERLVIRRCLNTSRANICCMALWRLYINNPVVSMPSCKQCIDETITLKPTLPFWEWNNFYSRIVRKICNPGE